MDRWCTCADQKWRLDPSPSRDDLRSLLLILPISPNLNLLLIASLISFSNLGSTARLMSSTSINTIAAILPSDLFTSQHGSRKDLSNSRVFSLCQRTPPKIFRKDLPASAGCDQGIYTPENSHDTGNTNHVEDVSPIGKNDGFNTPVMLVFRGRYIYSRYICTIFNVYSEVSGHILSFLTNKSTNKNTLHMCIERFFGGFRCPKSRNLFCFRDFRLRVKNCASCGVTMPNLPTIIWTRLCLQNWPKNANLQSYLKSDRLFFPCCLIRWKIWYG